MPAVNLPPVLRPVFAPALILAVATLALWLGPALPASLAGLRTAGPYAVLGAAVAVGAITLWWCAVVFANVAQVDRIA